jgi:hypothetical protein
LAEDYPMKNSFLSRVLPPPLVSVALLFGALLLLVPRLAVAQLAAKTRAAITA